MTHQETARHYTNYAKVNLYAEQATTALGTLIWNFPTSMVTKEESEILHKATVALANIIGRTTVVDAVYELEAKERVTK